MQLKAAFAPYKPAGAMRVTRHDAGSLTELNYTVPLRCLELACISGIGTSVNPQAGAPRSFRFAPGSLLYTDPGKKTPRLLRAVVWPKLESASRINGQDPTQVFGFPFRGSLTPLPSITYRVSPPVLAAILLVLAALLLVLPITLVVRRLRRRPPPVEEPEPEVTPLERALQLVEWSRGRPDPEERRSALEALAAELDFARRRAARVRRSRRGLAAAVPRPRRGREARCACEGGPWISRLSWVAGGMPRVGSRRVSLARSATPYVARRSCASCSPPR